MTTYESAVPALGTIYMYASGACNLNCSHCWINPEFDERGSKGTLHLSLELVKKAVTQGKPLGLTSVKLTGGEPLLNPEITDIIRYIADQGLGVSMETNGTLVTQEMAEFLASVKRLFSIAVSLDGADARTHDDLRLVDGAFDRAVQGIENLVEAGRKPQVICTLHRNNVDQIVDVIQLAIRLGCDSVKFNHVQPSGRGRDFNTCDTLTVPELIALDRKIEDELIPTAGILIHPFIPFAFLKPAGFLRSITGKCHVHNIIGLLANGDLALCGIGTSVKELLYGNLNRDDLGDVWRSSPGLAELRRLIPDELEGICSRCIHKRFCQGTCVAGNFNTGGKLNAPYYFCETAHEMGLFPQERIAIFD